VDECNKAGIRPFFYHTLIDWHNKDCEQNFPKYIDYLVKSVELLCTEYGEIGGLWFDGWWDKPTADWQFDRLYSMIRSHQPNAMIINNTGMDEGKIGTVGHPEIDSVTYERGVARPAPKTDRPVAGEMCEVLFDHWGYSSHDIHYKSLPYILEELVRTRACGCNFLLNIGPMGNGSVRLLDKAYLEEIGKWIKYNKSFIYKARPADIKVENAEAFIGEDGAYYVVSVCPTRVLMEHESLGGKSAEVHFPLPIKSARWLDNGKSIKHKKGVYTVEPFSYGINMHLRVARIIVK
jgi:alpha-L-fucosidase